MVLKNIFGPGHGGILMFKVLCSVYSSNVSFEECDTHSLSLFLMLCGPQRHWGRQIHPWRSVLRNCLSGVRSRRRRGSSWKGGWRRPSNAFCLSLQRMRDWKTKYRSCRASRNQDRSASNKILLVLQLPLLLHVVFIYFSMLFLNA